MIKKFLSSYLFTFMNLALLALALWSARTVSSQQPTETMIIGGEQFAAGMSQQEAMKKLEKCCFTSGGTDPRYANVKSFFIFKKDKSEILGTIWFRGEKVERLQRDGEFSQDPETSHFALSLYRLLSERTHSSPATTIVLRTGTSETSNAPSKAVTFEFRDGRSVQMEIVTPDDPQKLPYQVALKEILEKR